MVHPSFLNSKLGQRRDELFFTWTSDLRSLDKKESWELSHDLELKTRELEQERSELSHDSELGNMDNKEVDSHVKWHV